MTHYFTDNRQLPQNRKKHEFRIWGFRVCFITDNGVFSKTQVDFGSELLLKSLVLDDMEGKVLDVGCGYGTLGISLKVGKPTLDIDMIDVNDRALELVALNAEENKVSVKAFKSNMFENVIDDYNHIITNPPIRAGKAVVYGIFEGAYKHLKENGALWVVIRKQQGAKSAIEEINRLFGNCIVVDKEKGYYILKAVKSS